MMMKRTIKFLDHSAVEEIVSYSSSQIRRLEKSGQFPKRVRIGANRVVWIEDEIKDWIDAKIKEARLLEEHSHGAAKRDYENDR